MLVTLLTKVVFTPRAFAQGEISASGKRLAVRTIETLANPVLGLIFAVAVASFLFGLVRYVHYGSSGVNSEESDHATSLMKGSATAMVIVFLIFTAFNYARLGVLAGA